MLCYLVIVKDTSRNWKECAFRIILTQDRVAQHFSGANINNMASYITNQQEKVEDLGHIRDSLSSIKNNWEIITFYETFTLSHLVAKICIFFSVLKKINRGLGR